MNVNADTLKGKWRQVKGEIQKTWGKLTNDEIERTEGNYDAIAGLVQERYGHSKEDFQTKMSDLLGRFNDKVEEKTEEYKSKSKPEDRIV